MTDSEIATYLALAHRSTIYPREYKERGVYMTRSIRRNDYCLTQDAYESHRALSAFDLVQRQDHPHRHSDGKVKNFKKRGIADPYRFKLLERGFHRDAIEVIRDRLDLVGHI